MMTLPPLGLDDARLPAAFRALPELWRGLRTVEVTQSEDDGLALLLTGGQGQSLRVSEADEAVFDPLYRAVLALPGIAFGLLRQAHERPTPLPVAVWRREEG